MIKTVLLAGLAAVALTGPAQAAIVNVDSASPLGTAVQLAAGTYQISMVGIADGGLYNAYDQFAQVANGQIVLPVAPAVSGCDAGGSNCFAGFANGFSMSVGGGPETSYNLSLDPAQGSRFSTALGALAAFQTGSVIQTTGGIATFGSNLLFTLASASTVNFRISDTFYFDNTGGVSLNVAAVPEPATWAMMFLGFAMIAGVARYRRRATNVIYA